MGEEEGCIVHGTAVSLAGRAVLFLGPAGSGKSGHGLALMALGAELVADDRCVVRRRAEALVVSAPPTLSGLIEARGVGILRVAWCPEAPLALAVDLSRDETQRLPPRRRWQCLGREVPLLRRPASEILLPAIVQLLGGGSLVDEGR